MELAAVDTNATREQHNHFTYWTARSASGLDRFYVATAISATVQAEQVEKPKRQSDHQAAVLTLKEA